MAQLETDAVYSNLVRRIDRAIEILESIAQALKEIQPRQRLVPMDLTPENVEFAEKLLEQESEK